MALAFCKWGFTERMKGKGRAKGGEEVFQCKMIEIPLDYKYD